MRFLINSKEFNSISDILIKPFIFLSLVLLTIGLVFAFYLSPEDYQQGSTVRIIYIHVPSAWLALMTYLIMTIYSLIALAFRMPFGYIVNSAVAPIGAIFTLVCIISGSLWGKPMWGTWWVWDARLTSVLVLFFFYIGYIIFLKSFSDFTKGEKFSSILSIIGIVNLPIIKFSVDYWNTLHQPASISKFSSPSIHIDMLIPLIVMFLSFLFLFLYILILRFQAELIIRKININNMKFYKDS